MGDSADFIWSAKEWYIEEDSAWFIDAERSVLCCLNLHTEKCDGVVQIPNTAANSFMFNTDCVKVKNEIFCMPGYGDRVWIYDLINETFQFIKIENQSKDTLFMDFCYIYGDELFCVSRGMWKVVAINIKTKKVTYYPLDFRKEEKFLSCCIRVETDIYCVSSNSNRIYQFDMKAKKTAVYSILDENIKFSSICFDGEKFWLSGYNKTIYIWHKENDTVNSIDKFPKEFGNYIFAGEKEKILDRESEKFDVQLFCRLESVGNYIWAIPYKTNAILYIDKNTYEMHTLFVENEEETKESLTRPGRRSFKYFWQYKKDGRYIGVFSLKNNCVLEIDTQLLKVEPRRYTLTERYMKMIKINRTLFDYDGIDRMLFAYYLSESLKYEKTKSQNENVGMKIYDLSR